MLHWFKRRSPEDLAEQVKKKAQKSRIKAEAARAEHSKQVRAETSTLLRYVHRCVMFHVPFHRFDIASPCSDESIQNVCKKFRDLGFKIIIEQGQKRRIAAVYSG